MAIIINHTNKFGQTEDFYWRLNSFEQLPNRQPDGVMSVPAVALFRSYASEEAFKNGCAYIEERLVPFAHSSMNANMAEEAYAARKNGSIPAAVEQAISHSTALVEGFKAKLDDIEQQLSDSHIALQTATESAEPDKKAITALTMKIAELTTEADTTQARMTARLQRWSKQLTKRRSLKAGTKP